MRKKFFLFLLSILFLIPGMLLVGCGEDKPDQPPESPERTLSYIELNYNGTTYDIHSEGGTSYWVYYQENLVLNQADFSATAIYSDGEREQITSGFTFNIYQGNTDENPIAWGTALEIGSYRFVYEYNQNSATNYFEVRAKELSDATIALEYEEHDYTGEQLCPSVTVTLDTEVLVAGTDYTVAYGTNIVNEGRVTITGQGRYTGTEERFFVIRDIQIDPSNSLTIADIEWNDSDHKEEINATISAWAVAEELSVESVKYFIVEEGQNVETSSVKALGWYCAEIHIAEKQGYSFSTTVYKSFTILPQNISNLVVGALTPVEYNWEEHHASEFEDEIAAMDLGVTYGLRDYLVPYDERDIYDNTNASTSTKTGVFELYGTGNYSGSVLVPFTILQYDVNAAGHTLPTQNAQFNFEYDGTAKVPSDIYLTLVLDPEQGARSLYNFDYTFSCSNNVNAGDAAQINVEFCGNYAGTATYYFSIGKRNVDLTENEFWTGNHYVTHDSYPYMEYQFAYNRTNHLSEVAVNTEQTFFEDTASPITFDQLFNVSLEYDLGTYPESSLVWIETDDFTNASHSGRLYRTVATIIMIDSNHTFTIGGYDKNQIEVGVSVSQAVATFSEESLAGKEYDGTPYVATYTLTADLGGETPYSLVAGTDYNVLYYLDLGQDPIANAIHADHYGTRISFVNYNYRLADGYYEFSFDITKKRVLVTDSIITWPTANRMVWSSTPILQNDGSISLPGVSAENIGSYEFELAYNYGLTPTHIHLDARNFEVGYYDVDNDNTWTLTNKEITTFESIENPFVSFYLNGTALNISQIDALNAVNIFDEIKFTLKEGAQLNRIWYLNNSDYYETGTSYTADDEEVTIVAGTDVKALKDGKSAPSGEYPGDLWIYSQDGAYEGYENRFSVTYNGHGGSRDITIRKNIFKTFKFGNTIIKDDNQSVTNWSLLGQAYSQTVSDGDVIALEFADGYNYIALLRGWDLNGDRAVAKWLEGDGEPHTNTQHTVNVTGDKATPAGSRFIITITNQASGKTFDITIVVS